MQTTDYFDLIVNMMILIWIEGKDFDSPEVVEALSLLEEETSSMCDILQNEQRGLFVSPDFPVGYLAMDLGQTRVAIPWPLVTEIPRQDVIAVLREVARNSSVGSESNICLSGSSCRIELVKEISDVDFCEYMFDSDEYLDRRLWQTLSSSSDTLHPVEAKLFGNPHDNIKCGCPFPSESGDLTEKQSMFLGKAKSSVVKIDFIGDVDGVGCIPVTNVAIPVKLLSDSASGQLSFFFQEIVFLGDGPRGPWPLLQIDQMLGYIRFLARDAESYLRSKPIKALKRASALSRFLFVEGYEKRFSDAFASEHARFETRKARREELKKLASQAAELLPQKWIDRIAALDEGGADDQVQTLAGNGKSTNLVETFLRDLKLGMADDLRSHIFEAASP